MSANTVFLFYSYYYGFLGCPFHKSLAFLTYHSTTSGNTSVFFGKNDACLVFYLKNILLQEVCIFCCWCRCSNVSFSRKIFFFQKFFSLKGQLLMSNMRRKWTWPKAKTLSTLRRSWLSSMQDRAYRVKLSVNVKLLACSVSTIELCLSMRISCKVHCLQKSEGEILVRGGNWGNSGLSL